VCINFRGMQMAKATLKRATHAARTIYASMREREPEVLSKQHVAFALSYLAAHLGLNLVTERMFAKTMDLIIERESDLARRVSTSGGAARGT
jgi:hypothetical protein